MLLLFGRLFMHVCVFVSHTHTHTHTLPLVECPAFRSRAHFWLGACLLRAGEWMDTRLHIKPSILSTARPIPVERFCVSLVRCIYIVTVPQMHSSETVCKAVNQMVHTFTMTKEQLSLLGNFL